MKAETWNNSRPMGARNQTFHEYFLTSLIYPKNSKNITFYPENDTTKPEIDLQLFCNTFHLT